MTLEDIKVWVIVRGVGHVVMSRNDSSILGTITACGMGGNMHDFTEARPQRVCRKCRDELPHIYRIKEGKVSA